ncbi:MAG: deoxyhypusine synthase [Candidatus Woesearchaeota archaeon]
MKKHRQYSVKASVDLSKFPKVKGCDLDALDFGGLIESYATTGFQATNLSQAITVVNLMRNERATIFLGYTSNVISSGLRDIIRTLVKNKCVHVLVTTAGGIEEDIIKCFTPFRIGSFDVPGKYLLDKGVCRIGNILVPNEAYTHYERFMNEVFKDFAKAKMGSVCELINLMGMRINNEDSVLYWAYKNRIPVFCPGITDGSTGDMVYFEKQRHKDFTLDISEDMNRIVDIALNAKKTGVILLGGGIAKHFVLNANIFRDGADYAVYINTGQEFDGSDSGARVDEAVTWLKIRPDAPSVKVFCDATIAFPLIVAATFFSKQAI